MNWLHMRLFAYALLTVSASGSAVSAASAVDVEQHVVIRIRTYSSFSAPKPIVWRERKGPKCIHMDQLGGAAITQPDSVDLTLRGGQFVRARLEKGCPAHDFFYSGFYLSPAPDGQICAGRDVVHARIGGDCGITKFRSLVPHK